MIKPHRAALLRSAVILAAMGLALAIMIPRRVAADAPPLCAIYPIPAYYGVSAQPSVSGDGSLVAFWSTSGEFAGSDNADGNVEIFIQLGTNGVFTRTRQVTNSKGTVLGGFNLGPAISGDSKRVAFFSDRDLIAGKNADGSFELFLADVAGLAGNPDAPITLTQVTSSTTTGINTWPSINSPANSDTFPVYYIAFASDQNYTGANPDGNTEIFRAKVDGPTITFVQVTSTTVDFTNDFPAISVDGSRIAFATNSNSPGSAAASVSVAKITNDVPSITTLQSFASQTNGQIAISADGYVVAWSSDIGTPSGADDRTQIWVARDVLSGTQNLRQVTYVTTTGLLTSTNSQPALDLTGGLVAFVATTGAGSSLYLAVTSDGGAAPVFIDFASESGHPRFSYNGQNIVFGAPQSTSGLSASTVKYGDCKNTDLKISGSITPTGPNPGEFFTHTLRIQNIGQYAVNGAVLDVRPPEGISAVASDIRLAITQGACGSVNPTSMTCTLGALLGVNQVVTATASYRLLPTSTNTVVGYYTVTSPLSDTNPADNALALPVFVSAADSQAGIAVFPDSLAPGETAIYTFSVTALGPNRSQTGTLSASLSPSTTVLSLTPGQTVSSAGNLAWTVLPIDVGNTRIYTALVRVDPTLRATLTATVVISMPRDPNGDNDSASVATAISPRAALSISKFAQTGVAYTGDWITYTLRVTNAGPSAVSAVRIDDLIPDAVFDNVSSSTSLGSCGTPNITCLIPNLPPNTTVVIAIGARVFTDTSIFYVNTAVVVTATDPAPSGVSSSASVTVALNMVDLQARSTTTPVLTAGLAGSYSFAAYNSAPAAVSNVMLTASLPSAITGTSVISAFSVAGNPGPSCVYLPDPDNSLVCALPSLTGNTSFTATLNFTVNPGATGIFTDAFTVYARAQDNAPDNNTLTRTVALAVSAPLTVSLEAQPGLVVGGIVTYTTVVTNPGPSLAPNVVLVQAMPKTTDLAFGEAQADGGASCAAREGFVFTCTLGLLSGNQGFNVILTATVNVTAAQVYTTQAMVWSDAPPTTSDAPARDVLVQAEGNLIVTKVANAQVAYDNDNVVFTVLITNAGPRAVSGVVMTDLVSSLLLDNSGRLVSAPSPSAGGRCSNRSTEPIRCTFSTIGAGATATVTITSRVNSSASVWVTNTASAFGNGAESDPADNAGSAYVAINAYDLEARQNSAGPIAAGTQGSWTFYRSNNSPQNASSVTLVATLPAGINVTGQSPAGCSFAAPTLSCSGITVNAGVSAPVYVTFTVGAGLTGTLVNTVTVSMAGALDPNPGNNTIVSVTQIAVSAPLTVSMRIPPLAPAGGIMTYTMRVTNTGPASAASSVLSVGLAAEAGLSYGAPIGPGCGPVAGATLTCALGTIQSGASLTVLLPVNVASVPDSYGGVAYAYSANPPTTQAQPAVSGRIISLTQISLVKTANTGLATNGDTITYTLLVTNPSSSMTLTAAVVVDVLPPGTQLITVTASAIDPPVCATSLVVSCGLGALGAGQSAWVTITALITATSPGPLTNTASASASAADPNVQVVGANATAVVTAAAVDLRAVSPAQIPSPLVAGNSYVLAYGVANASATAAADVTLTASLPVSIAVGPLAPGCAYAAPALTCPGLTVAGGTTATVNFTFTLNDTASGSFVEVIRVASSSQMPDPSPANNVLTRTTPISVSAPLTVSILGAAPATTTLPFTYTVLVTNSGPSLASGARMTQSLPVIAGLTFGVPITQPGASCSAVVSAKFSCSLGNLGSGAAAMIAITATVTSVPASPFTTTVTAFSLADPTMIGAPAVVTYALEVRAPLTVSVSGTAPVTTTAPFTYTVIVTNTGPSLAAGARITQVLPAAPGLVFSPPMAPPGATCAPPAAGQFTCSFGEVAASGTRTVIITATVASVPTTTFTTTVSAYSLASPTTAGAPAVVSYPIVVAALLTASVRGTSPVTTTAPFIYTTLITNTGPSVAVGARMSQTLPGIPELTFGAPSVSGAGACGSVVANAFGCGLGDLPVLAVVQVTITATVSSVPTQTFTTTITTFSQIAPTTSSAPLVVTDTQ